MKRNVHMLLLLLFLSIILTGCTQASSNASAPVSVTQTETTRPSTVPDTSSSSMAHSSSMIESSDATIASSDGQKNDLTDGVILGRSVFVHSSGVAFWGADEKLCSALTDENGNLYDFIIEAELPSHLWNVAILGDDCFLATSDGLLRFSLSEFEQGSAQMDLLCDNSIYDGFSIYQDQIYYQSGSSLMQLSLSGGEPEPILSGIQDYEITTQGIYYTDEDGGLFLESFDGAHRELLVDTPAQTNFILQNETMFYWTPDQAVFCWTPSTETSEQLQLSGELDPEESLWLTGDVLIYTDTSGDVYQYTLSDNRDVLLDLFALPEKDNGFLWNGILYYSYSDSVYWDNLTTGQGGNADLSDFSENTASPSNSAVENSSFDISAGMEVHVSGDQKVITTNYFSLALPESPSWEVEIVDNNTLIFYYTPAKDAGYGGKFLSIRAYDWSDNGYSDLPHWSLAGLDAQKKYVAIFPTDVQFDPNDSSQNTEYHTLLSAAQTIDSNSSQNPFVILNP